MGENPYQIPTESLFTLATRNNAKRKFLFVSKVLGKHLAVKPNVCLNYGALLAYHWLNTSGKYISQETKQALEQLKDTPAAIENLIRNPEKIGEPSLVLGFAETATGLAHSIFDVLEDAVGFYHTTREVANFDGNIINFEEEHSHATAHKVYECKAMAFSDVKRIILVDDEISTGKTLLNIITEVHKQYGVMKFSVLSLLDFRNSEDQSKFDETASAYGIEIDVTALVKGKIKQVIEGDLSLETIKSHSLFQEEFDQVKENVPICIPKIINANLEMGVAVTYRSICGEKHYLPQTGRFGLNADSHKELKQAIDRVALNIQPYVNGNTLVLGTEEFMFTPLLLASALKGEIKYKSTTRSPIYVENSNQYSIQSGHKFKSYQNPEVANYIYNLHEERYDTIFIVLEDTRDNGLDLIKSMNEALHSVTSHIYFIQMGNKETDVPNYPIPLGSYPEKDVTFLLKPLEKEVAEEDNGTREAKIQSGLHYSEMLPVEHKPSDAYMEMYHRLTPVFSKTIAEAVGILCEKVLKARGEKLVLVSLARAGTPAGILMKRYYQQYHDLDIPHYSISIIRGKGIDENAMKYILHYHPNMQIQFVDGWTGKGAITNELSDAVKQYKEDHGEILGLKPDLAVIADPGHCTPLFGTREDLLLPNACLNATVSGLISRTVHRTDLVGALDFHRVKFYKELAAIDFSNHFIEQVESHFKDCSGDSFKTVTTINESDIPTWKGLKDVEKIQKDFQIDNIHFVKPGIGETTRVLLRRLPEVILVSEQSEDLEHILQLAKEKNVPVEHYPLEAYKCCGIIRTLKGE